MITVSSEVAMRALGKKIGTLLRGGEVIELVGDVGAGKTTLVKGIGEGLAISETIQSPSFTISRAYDARDSLYLVHYDFYRLPDAGIMAADIAENTTQSDTITIVEWAEVVDDVLPTTKIRIQITTTSESSRTIEVTLPDTAEYLIEVFA